MSEEITPDALPPEMNAVAEVLVTVREDQGPFEKVGSGFSCNKVAWLGKAYASPVAVYLVKVGRNARSGYGGGLAGSLLSAALSTDDGLSTCTAADLPDPIRMVFNRKGKLDKKNVVIVPKATVSMVKTSALGGNIKLTAGEDNFKIMAGLFGKSKTFRRLGWELNTPLTPTVAPVHDMRSEAEKVVKEKPLWQKILLVAGAVAIIAGYILLRVFMHMH